MRTSRPFSTVVYNTPEYLNQVLDDLVKRNVLVFYVWIYHYKEKDEGKDHKHLLMIPNGQQQTDGIRSLLEEIDLTDPLHRPFVPQPFRSSKFDDWYLYALHDTAYLATKGQSREYHYLHEDFHTSSADALHEMSRTIDRSKYTKTQDFVNAVMQGVPFFDLVRTGQVPAPQFMQWQNLYNFIAYSMLERAEGETHTPCDPETGEVSD